MARYINECNAILRNLSQEIRSRCLNEDQYCCFLHCCFINRQHNEIWETWYFWFGVALIGLLMFTSALSFIVGMCTKKRHQLIRVHHQAGAAGRPAGSAEDSVSVPVTAITGPDGLIQPHVPGGLPAEVAARYKTQGAPTDSIIYGRNLDEDGIDAQAEAEGSGACGGRDGDGVVDEEQAVAGPLEPAYPPMQPVTIVRGPIPVGGFRQTETYTELVLPPGYVDPQPSQKRHHRP